jgi:hypothetical protein
MAKYIREHGTKNVLLGGIVRDLTKPLIPDDVLIIGPWNVKEDMVHLIVEYSKGEVLFEGEQPTDRANRCDRNNHFFFFFFFDKQRADSYVLRTRRTPSSPLHGRF